LDYRVELDVYNGPLDLLLYLIKRDELDIYDIPIAQITDSYMAYVNMMREMSREGALDINIAGDFLVMAATLMEIKSAMLLPKAPAVTKEGETSAADELADPRYELVQQLLEYKRFKDSALALERAAESHQNRFPRYPAKAEGVPDEPPPVDLDEVQIWDLLEAFSRLMKEVGVRTRQHEVTYDDTPIDLHAADIEDRLKREKKLTLRALIVGRKSRSEMIGVFLALLELIRQKKILVEQPEVLGDLEIVPAPEEHRKAYVEAGDPIPPADPAPADLAPPADTSPVEEPPAQSAPAEQAPASEP
jgi:segregation and condensation protein A